MSATYVLNRDLALPVKKLGKYRCPTCHKRFQRTTASVSISCCVLHSPGACCHFMESEVARKGWAKRLVPS